MFIKSTLLPLAWIISIILFQACGSKPQEPQDPGISPTIEPQQIVGLAQVEPQEKVLTLNAETGGLIQNILFKIDDTIQKGSVIIELESSTEKAQWEQAINRKATQESMIENARAELATREIKLTQATREFNRNQQLVKSGGSTSKSLEDSQSQMEQTQAEVKAGKAMVNQQLAKLKELSSDIQYYYSLLERKLIRAPLSGKLLSMEVKPGEYATSQDALCDFAPDGPWVATTEIDEVFADKIQKGYKAFIRTQGGRDTLGTGTVWLTSPYLRKKTLFSDQAANLEDRRVREVRVLLDPPVKALLGSRVECVILLP
jgi:multidrug resistance efflux pump